MSQRRIYEQWVSFSGSVIPGDASHVQRVEMKRSFYAGAQALLSVVLTMLDPGTEPTEADLRKMDEIQKELEQYCQDVKEGRA